VHFPDGVTSFLPGDEPLRLGETWKTIEAVWRVIRVVPSEESSEYPGGIWDVWVEPVVDEQSSCA